MLTIVVKQDKCGYTWQFDKKDLTILSSNEFQMI